MQYGATKRYVTRKLAFNVQAVDASRAVLASDLAGQMPSGSKILALRVRSFYNRWIRVQVPNGTGLTVDTFTSGAAFISGLDRWASAPLSKFPTIKVNVPDLLAKPIDTGASPTSTLFTVIQPPGSTQYAFEICLTVKYMA